jgi:serine/threonine-protein kinase
MSRGHDPEGLRQSASNDLTGKMIGRFIIRAKLGAGGMGEVFRAEDTKLKRTVAMKRVTPELASDEKYRRRILKEAERASRLSNPHVAQIFDVLEEPSGIYLVMEYIEGESLRERLRRPMSLADFMKVAVECAQALVAAHEKNIIHCDLKPENIMLTPAGEVKILDFGVAREVVAPKQDPATRSLDTASGTLRGTPAYMAPEVLLEQSVNARADIFSLGVVFYEALAGTHPFRAASFMATSDRILHVMPPPLSEINRDVKEGVSRVVMKMIAKKPDERFPSAHVLLDELGAAREAITHPSLLPRHITAPALKLPIRRTAYLALSLFAVGIVVVVILVWRRNPAGGGATGGPAQQEQLAVLPFVAVGGSPEAVAFGDGLTETLTARLTQLAWNRSLQIVPAGEVRAGHVKSAEEARQQFGANVILEGSLERSGEMVRVTFSVVDPKSKRQLKAGTVTAPASNPFAVEDQVVEDVAQMLSLNPLPGATPAAASRGTQMPGAYDLYLEGRGYLQNYDRPENTEKAIGAFEGALRIDPNDALAYAGLGEAYLQKYSNSNQAPWVASAREACQKAVAFDVNLATARTCLGLVDNATGQYEKATKEFDQTLSTQPANDDAYRGLATAQEHLGKVAEAEKTFRRAIEVRPQYWAGYSWLGSFYYGQGRYSDAAQMFARAVELVPDNFRCQSNLGAAYLAESMYSEAITSLEHSIAIRPTSTAFSNLATAYYYLHRFDDAALTYRRALKLDQSDYLVWGNLGDAEYRSPGRRDEATVAYRNAIEQANTRLRVNPRDATALSYRAEYLARLGDRTRAFSDANRAVALSPKDPVLELNRALVNTQFGRTDAALDSIEKAIAGGVTSKMVRDDPSFDPLRSNPRFQKLVQRP